MRERPFGVTILAIQAGVPAILAAIHALQFLGIIPFFIGGAVPVRYVSIFPVLMDGILVWIYIWLLQMLWRVEPQAWMFLVFVTVFELMLDFISMLGKSTWQDVSVSFYEETIKLQPSTLNRVGLPAPSVHATARMQLLRTMMSRSFDPGCT
jgi:hypothetical protein